MLMFSNLSHAGMKGFDVLMLNIGTSSFFEQKIFEVFVKRWSDRVEGSCWENLKSQSYGISHITKNKLPLGMNAELAKNIWKGDARSIQIAREIMHKDDGSTESGEGYHGLYILKPESNKLTILGLGANQDQKHGLTGVSSKFTVTLDPSKPEKSATIFEQALCKASKPFNIGFSV